MSDPTRTQHAPTAGSDAESEANDPTQPRAAGAPPRGFGPPAHEGEVGTLGRYRVLQQLGAGGMGAVYLGYHTGLQCKVALKVMLPGAATDSAARERFLREARTAAQVKSDHVVTIHDVDEANGVPFIAMEYLLGAPLDAYLKKKGELPLEQAVRIVRECALGLAAVHAQGLIHRDIKPGNIWLQAPHGRAKLLDFGLARSESDEHHITSTGGVVGTVAYMSPQQGRGEKVDARTDLWSLGVVLYRLCTGRMPFEGASQMAVLTSIALDVPPAPRAVNASLPPALEAVILTLLAKDPGARYQTAHAAAEALAAVERGDGPHLLVPVPQELTVGAQTQNVWESIADDSESVAVPMATSADATEVSRVAPPRRTSKVPLLLGAGALVAALVGLVAVALAPGKKPEAVKKEEPPPEPVKGRLSILDARPGTEFALKRDGVVVVPKTGSRSLQLEPGRYTIEFVSTVAPGTKIVPDTFEVTPGGRYSVSVKGPTSGPEVPETKVYDLPADLIAPLTPVKPNEVFSLDYLDPAKHIPADEQFDWQPKELVAALGSHRQRLRGGSVNELVFSSDGSVLLAGHNLGRTAFNTATGKSLNWPLTTVLSPDSKRAAFGNKIWQVADPQKVVEYGSVGDILAFLTDEIVLTLGEGGYVVWKLDPKAPKPLARFEGGLSFALSNDRKRLAVLSKDDSACTVYDVTAEGPKKKYALPGEPGKALVFPDMHLHYASFSDNGLLAVISADRLARIWDVTGPKPELKHTLGKMNCVALYPKGDFLLGVVPEKGTELWALNEADPRRVAGVPSFGVTDISIAVCPDGETFATGNTGGAVHFWGIEKGVTFEKHPIRPGYKAANTRLSPDGRYTATYEEWGNAASVLWNFADMSLQPIELTGNPRFSPDGGLLCDGNGVGLRLFQRGDGFKKVVADFGSAFAPLAYHPNGKWFAAISGAELQVWDVSASPPKELFPSLPMQLLDVRFSSFTPDGQFFVTCSNEQALAVIRIWSVTARGLVPRSVTIVPSVVGFWGAALAPDGRTLVATGGAAFFYDLKDGVPTLRREDKVADAHIAYAPDGRTLLLSGSGLVKLVDAASGKVLHQWQYGGAVAHWHPDGRHVVVNNYDGTIYVLRVSQRAAPPESKK